MKDIHYSWSESQIVLGASVRFFDRLGPEGYIPSYEIVTTTAPLNLSSFAESGLNLRTVHGIGGRENVVSIVKSSDFQALLQEKPKGSEVLLYANNMTPSLERWAQKLGIKILANPSSLRHEFENKRMFRNNLADHIRVPLYEVCNKQDLVDSDAAYDKWKTQFGDFVMQEETETVSGSRGTRIVRSRADFAAALSQLASFPGTYMVISKFIQGQVASMQGCVAGADVFTGPLQKQFVGFPELVKSGHSQFAGGQWGYAGFSEDAKQQAREIVRTVGGRMAADEYKGLFGVDVIVGDDGHVYAIEVNARPTVLTPLIAMIQRECGATPLLIPHILEHAGCSYAISDPVSYQQSVGAEVPLSYAILHNLTSQPVHMKTLLEPGVYSIDGEGFISFQRFGFDLQHIRSPHEFLVTDVPQKECVIKPGKMLVRILTRDNMLDEQGAIHATYASVIQWIHAHYDQVE